MPYPPPNGMAMGMGMAGVPGYPPHYPPMPMPMHAMPPHHYAAAGMHPQMPPMPPLHPLAGPPPMAGPGMNGTAATAAAAAAASIKEEKKDDKDNSSNNNNNASEEDNDDSSNTKDQKQGGLDLLASLALPVGGVKDPDSGSNAAPADNPHATMVGGIDISTTSKKPKKKSSRSEDLASKEKLYVEKVRDCDVLCGRGGKSNHHGGNKKYRQVVSEMKRTYQGTGAKTAKTDLSRAIVEHVVGYGGRFIKRDETNGKYFLLTKAQARRKTSQALRETKELKWTM